MRIERDGPDVRLSPAGEVNAVLRPPGSKSLTNRYLTCLALADGLSTLRNAGFCDDTERMAAGLTALGIPTQLDPDARTITVRGVGGHVPAASAELDPHNAGTAMRFLTALTALGDGAYRLDGSPRMRERPIRALVDALVELGAYVEYELTPGCPPLLVRARGLNGGEVYFDAPPSSQYVSALLMVAPYARQDVFLAIDGGVPSKPYLDMTLDVMRRLGVDLVDQDYTRFVVPAQQRYQPAEVEIEPDASGATYLWAAAAIAGGRVRVAPLTRASRQGDVHFVAVLERMGCTLTEGPDYLEIQGPPRGQLRGIDVDLNAMPDTVQTLAVVALFATGDTNVTNVANLRIKETDRIAALAAELTKLGATVAARDDGLTISPPARLRPAAIDTYDDHRMAMSFALAGVVVDGVVIREADCVRKSFPEYFDVLATIDG